MSNPSPACNTCGPTTVLSRLMILRQTKKGWKHHGAHPKQLKHSSNNWWLDNHMRLMPEEKRVQIQQLWDGATKTSKTQDYLTHHVKNSARKHVLTSRGMSLRGSLQVQSITASRQPTPILLTIPLTPWTTLRFKIWSTARFIPSYHSNKVVIASPSRTH